MTEVSAFCRTDSLRYDIFSYICGSFALSGTALLANKNKNNLYK